MTDRSARAGLPGLANRSAAIARLAGDAPALLWVALAAFAVAALYGSGFVGYDTMYSLIWGRELADGNIPNFETPHAPTPHPLAYILGAGLSVFGDSAPTLAEILVLFSYGLLLWAAFELGRTLFSWPVGLLFALILATRRFLVALVLESTVDVSYLALIVTAALVHARGRRGLPVLGILSVAGLLRPDAWLLAGAYWLFHWFRSTNKERARATALTASAPLLWAAFDLAGAGDPLHSLHGTQSLATELSRARGIGTAVDSLGRFTELIIGGKVMVVGLVGSAITVGLFFRRALLPLAGAGLALAAFFAIALADLPVLPRYVEAPAVALALGCAVAVFGWASLPHESRLLWPWIGASSVPLVLVCVSIVNDFEYTRQYSYPAERREVERDLRNLTPSATVGSAYVRCRGAISVPGYRVVPGAAFSLDVNPAKFRYQTDHAEGRLTVVAQTGLIWSLYRATGERAFPPPRDSRLVAENASWAVYSRC